MEFVLFCPFFLQKLGELNDKSQYNIYMDSRSFGFQNLANVIKAARFKGKNPTAYSQSFSACDVMSTICVLHHSDFKIIGVHNQHTFTLCRGKQFSVLTPSFTRLFRKPF